jgi:CHAT domain-containing protein/lipopolysaccharide biosynthesis regulator YciM
MLDRAAWHGSLLVLLVLCCSVGHAKSPERGSQEGRQLHEQARRLYDRGRYREAIPIAQRALAASEKALGAEHLEVADIAESLGRAYLTAGYYDSAEPVLRRALAIREKVLGPAHQGTAQVLVHLGNTYNRSGNFHQSGPQYRRSLAICEKVLGEEHTDTAAALHALGIFYTDMGKYEQADVLNRRALAIRERLFGTEHLETARVVYDRGRLHYTRGAYLQAEVLYQRALVVGERWQGASHPEVALWLRGLGDVYSETGAYLKAEQFYRRALSIQEARLGLQHPETVTSLNGLAALYFMTGSSTRAEPLIRRALASMPTQPAAGRLASTVTVYGLANLYFNMGEYTKAEPLYHQLLTLAEQRLGAENPYSGAFHRDLGRIYTRSGAVDRAESQFKRAIAVNEKAVGLEHVATAGSLTQLADLYSETGAYPAAERLYQRAIAIYQKALGSDHPYLAGASGNLGAAHWARGELQQALALFQRAQGIRARNSARFLLGGSEARKRNYLQSLTADADRDVSFSLSMPGQPARVLGLTSVLQYKGRVLDAVAGSVARLRRSIEPNDQALLEQLAQLATQLSTLTYRGTDTLSPEEYQERELDLVTRQDALEAELAGRSSEFRSAVTPVTVASVARAIPANAVLVEWFRYTPFDPTLKRETQARPAAPRYVAYVLRRSGDLTAIDLGPAHALETLVQEFRAALSNPARGDIELRAAALSEKIVTPLRSHLAGVERILMSPDGALNLVPMTALVDERGEYLVHQFEMTYLTSGRDLLRMESKSAGDIVLVADPDYGKLAGSLARNNPVLQPQRSADLDRSGLIFRPLAYTALEVQDLKALLVLDAAHVLLRRNATEASLKRLHSPRILHIASHGFFLSDQQLSEAKSARSSMPMPLGENPLLRSGIALAGANQRRSGDAEDGILTALEVAQLDLHGTELVVLSACDTAVGEVQNGEGVYGLRRALALAGAQTQVASLWKVSDAATRTLMVDYYRRLLQGEGRSAALRQAQRAMLADPRLAHPYYWASLVPIGNWNPLSTLRAQR